MFNFTCDRSLNNVFRLLFTVLSVVAGYGFLTSTYSAADCLIIMPVYCFFKVRLCCGIGGLRASRL